MLRKLEFFLYILYLCDYLFICCATQIRPHSGAAAQLFKYSRVKFCYSDNAKVGILNVKYQRKGQDIFKKTNKQTKKQTTGNFAEILSTLRDKNNFFPQYFF